MWLLQAQCAVCSHAGLHLTPQDFGAPQGFGYNHFAKEQQQQQQATGYSLETPYGTDDNLKQAAPAAQRKPLQVRMPGM